MASGEHLARRAAVKSQGEIATVRPRMCEAACRIARAGALECGGERMVRAPAARVVQLDRLRRESPYRLRPIRLEALDHIAPRCRDQLPESREFRLPERGVSGLSAQRRVALLERAAIAHPGIDEVRFHVEHRPVDPAPPSVAAFLNQPVNPWLDDLYRECLGQVCQGLDWPGCHARCN